MTGTGAGRPERGGAASAGPEEDLRLAILSTPRSGNTWLRWLLREALALAEVAVHSPDEIPDPLPARVVVQLHWPRTEAFVTYLRAHGFRVLTLARHPLDVLLSVLHFVSHEPLTRRWLGGDAEVSSLVGHGPTSQEFARYAVGAGARALFGVTRQWWDSPDAVRVHYEALVRSTEDVLRMTCQGLDALPRRSLVDAVARCPLRAFQDMPNRHGWQGTPGLWRRLVVPDLARRVAAAHPGAFTTYGYACDPDPGLDAAQAARTWAALAVRTDRRCG